MRALILLAALAAFSVSAFADSNYTVQKEVFALNGGSSGQRPYVEVIRYCRQGIVNDAPVFNGYERAIVFEGIGAPAIDQFNIATYQDSCPTFDPVPTKPGPYAVVQSSNGYILEMDCLDKQGNVITSSSTATTKYPDGSRGKRVEKELKFEVYDSASFFGACSALLTFPNGEQESFYGGWPTLTDTLIKES